MNAATFHPQTFRIFCSWIAERESIRKKKEAGEPKPWTKAEILQSRRFCNVRRMDDKVSVWLLKNWYHPKADQRTLLIMACLARCINWPDSLEYTGLAGAKHLNWDKSKITTVASRLHDWESEGNKVFTGAYIVNGAGGGSKIDLVLRNVTAVAQSKVPVVHEDSMHDTWESLKGFNGFGSFMAGQVVADLRFTNAMTEEPHDCKIWAPMGPGSKRGMRRLRGEPEADGPMKEPEFQTLLRELIVHTKRELPEIFRERKLEAMDIQNCLCEVDKYIRVMNGEGDTRSSYPGTAETRVLI